jgi:hypothetical protein
MPPKVHLRLGAGLPGGLVCLLVPVPQFRNCWQTSLESCAEGTVTATTLPHWRSTSVCFLGPFCESVLVNLGPNTKQMGIGPLCGLAPVNWCKSNHAPRMRRVRPCPAVATIAVRGPLHNDLVFKPFTGRQLLALDSKVLTALDRLRASRSQSFVN